MQYFLSAVYVRETPPDEAAVIAHSLGLLPIFLVTNLRFQHGPCKRKCLLLKVSWHYSQELCSVLGHGRLSWMLTWTFSVRAVAWFTIGACRLRFGRSYACTEYSSCHEHIIALTVANDARSQGPGLDLWRISLDAKKAVIALGQNPVRYISLVCGNEQGTENHCEYQLLWQHIVLYFYIRNMPKIETCGNTQMSTKFVWFLSCLIFSATQFENPSGLSEQDLQRDIHSILVQNHT